MVHADYIENADRHHGVHPGNRLLETGQSGSIVAHAARVRGSQVPIENDAFSIAREPRAARFNWRIFNLAIALRHASLTVAFQRVQA